MELKPGNRCKHKGKLYEVIKLDAVNKTYVLKKIMTMPLRIAPLKVAPVAEVEPAENEPAWEYGDRVQYKGIIYEYFDRETRGGRAFAILQKAKGQPGDRFIYARLGELKPAKQEGEQVC